jgi:hypothetical protein
MRVSFKGRTAGFHPADVGSIPSTRTGVQGTMLKLLRKLFGSESRPSCQVFCPQCRNELTTCENSPYEYDEDHEAVIRYVCGACKTQSTWDFAAPAPILLSPRKH